MTNIQVTPFHHELLRNTQRTRAALIRIIHAARMARQDSRLWQARGALTASQGAYSMYASLVAQATILLREGARKAR